MRQFQLVNAYIDLVEMANEKELQIVNKGGQGSKIFGNKNKVDSFREGKQKELRFISQQNQLERQGFFSKLFACCSCKSSSSVRNQNKTILEKRPPVN